jgi:hypothetical protein
MKKAGNRLGDKYLRWIGIPVLSIIYTSAVNLPAIIQEHRVWWKQYLTDFVFVLICWTIAREIVRFCRKKFPGAKNTRQRVILLFFITVMMTFLEGFLIIAFLNYTLYYSLHFTLFDFFYTSGLILVFSLMIVSIYELLYSLQVLNQLAMEAEVLKRENLQTQLDSLKEQIKPHFLFNSLSTLIGLIDEDRDRSKKFVEELAFVYRYLLQSNEKELILLSDELAFIKAYYYLLKTRFENRLQLDIDIRKELLQQHIPALTLQLLLENAVKHNALSAENPLRITIKSYGEHQIEMTNNLQRKVTTVASTNTGLANLASKYKLLQAPVPEIFETHDQFKVRVSLISNSVL